MSRAIFLLSLTFTVLGCTATQPAGTAPGLPPAPSATQTAPNAAGHRNLQVLPRNLTRDELIAIMRNFTRSLGVRCNHCHVVTATTPEEKLDFASDAKEEKRVARVMIQMTNQINTAWLQRVEEAEGEEHAQAAAGGAAEPPRVSCWTCHRGQVEPEMPPPPPPRPAANP
jgi:hypothetical protein